MPGVPDIEEVYPDAAGDQTFKMRESDRRESRVELKAFENLLFRHTDLMTAETDNNMPVYGMNIRPKHHNPTGDFLAARRS